MMTMDNQQCITPTVEYLDEESVLLLYVGLQHTSSVVRRCRRLNDQLVSQPDLLPTCDPLQQHAGALPELVT